MLVAKLLKSTIYIIALAGISAGGAILMHSVLAYTGPSSEPPDDNISVVAASGWTTSGTNVYLSTLTDYVGIGTASPNKQLHIKTAAGSNAELDIQSASTNYWAIYHDETTEQLRFWNTDFAGNVGPGIGNVFVIDNDGTVLVKTPVDGDSDNVVATKGYVDAAAGGGDATLENQAIILANQQSIMGSGFNTVSHSLEQIALGTGDATAANQENILANLYNSTGWVAAGTYYSAGGNPTFCRQNIVSSSGTVSVSNINNLNACDTGKVCSSGACIAVEGTGNLTWSGSLKTPFDCNSAGGVVYDTGSGTICRFSGVSVSCPSGWTQAGNWQKYSSSPFGGDSMGNHTSTGPTTFSNQATSCTTQGSVYLVCMTVAPSEYWVTSSTCGYNPYNLYYPATSNNCSLSRSEVGCY